MLNLNKQEIVDQIWDQVSNRVSNQVENQVYGQVWNQIHDGQVWNQIHDQVRIQTWIQLNRVHVPILNHIKDPR